MERTWKNVHTTAPIDVEKGDAFALKVVAVVDSYAHFWSAYRGPSDWTDDRVADQGDKLRREAAEQIFPLLARCDHLAYNG